MNKEFLKNFKVGNATLPDEVINAIMQENQRDIDAAKANPGGNGGERRQDVHPGRSKPHCI